MTLQEMPEEITEDYLLTRAQEVIIIANKFLHIFDEFNKDMEPYLENITALTELDVRFKDIEKQFKVLTERIIIR
jgi:protein tyrosine/serine phosphatase